MKTSSSQLSVMSDTVTKGTIKHEASDPSPNGRPAYLKELGHVLAVDTETSGFDWFDGDRPFYGTISDFDRDYGYDLTKDDSAEDFYTNVLAADSLIYHNASFDIHMMVAVGGVSLDEILRKEIHDTDLLARVVLGAEVGMFGLKHLATNYLDPDAGSYEKHMKECMVQLGLIRKWDQKESPPGAYYTTWKAYPKVMEEYALKDTRYTYDLFYYLMERATEKDLAVYELERAIRIEPVKPVCFSIHG